MIYLELFLAFVRIGFTSFGGMSMLPLILEEMEAHGWMTAEDLTNLVAIAEMTPGSLGMNCATFAGTQTAGILGGIVAVLGVLTPTLTLTLAAALGFARFKKSAAMSYVLRVIKPITVAMVLTVLFTLGAGTFWRENAVDFCAIAIAAAAFYLMRRLKWGVPTVIALSAALGAVLYGALGLA